MGVIGQSLNSWLNQDISVMRQKSSPCLPRNRPSWIKVIPELLESGWEKDNIQCVEDFLNEYVEFSEVEKVTDKQLDDLVKKCKARLTNALAMHIDFLESLADEIKFDIDKINTRDFRIDYLKQDGETLVTDTELLSKMADILISKPQTRIDKMEHIWKFVNLAHKGGPMLSHGCGITNYALDDAIVDVLNCLSENK